jgi:hypothetical protein
MDRGPDAESEKGKKKKKKITNDARCTREIKSSIDKAEAEFNNKKTPFTNKLDLNLR